MIERCRALGRPIRQSRRPVRSRKLTAVVIEAKVDDADRGRAGVRKHPAIGKGGKFLIRGSQASSATLPRRVRNDVEVTRGKTPPGLQDMTGDGPKCLYLPMPPMRTIYGKKPHGRGVSGTAPVAKV